MHDVTRTAASALVRPGHRIGRRANRLAIAALLLVGGFLPGTSAPATSATVGEVIGGESVANLRTDVRLRKLHLVRPDLIQYPLAYDVYC